ncbi:MAG: major capsid protein P2 [Telluria sp.]
MFNKPLQQVIGVGSGQTATLRLQPENLTLLGVQFKLSGTTFDKTHLTSIKVKVGAKTIWDVTYSQINRINNYKNGADNAAVLLLDFTERDQALFPLKEAGALDLMALIAVGEVYIELKIAGDAIAPVIDAVGFFSRSQGNPWVLKYVPFNWTTNAAGKFTLPLQFRGSVLKRVWIDYAGADWAAGVDGNINRLEIKKNSAVIYDQTCRDARFMQSQFKKVPQSKMFVADFILDNNHDAHILTVRQVDTQGGKQLIYDAFEFNSFVTAAGGDAVTVIAEVLDSVTNL